MRRRSLSLLVALSLLAGCYLGGCYHYVRPTDAQRAASFAPHRDAAVAGESLGHYVRRRTAVIVWGATASAAHTLPSGRTLAIDFEPRPRIELGYGHAAAITTDGYFLTAAHCAEDHEPGYVVYYDGAGPSVAPMRVVARVTDEKSEIDVAVVRAEGARVPQVFEWDSSPAIKHDAPAVAVGFMDPAYFSRRMKYFAQGCIAGHVTGTEQCSCAILTATAIFSTVPLRPGDSGGPLVNALDGKLIGINTRGLLSWTGSGKLVAGSIRPDPAWVMRVIERDRQHPHELAGSLPTTLPTTRATSRRVRSVLFSLDGDEVLDAAVAEHRRDLRVRPPASAASPWPPRTSLRRESVP